MLSNKQKKTKKLSVFNVLYLSFKGENNRFVYLSATLASYQMRNFSLQLFFVFISIDGICVGNKKRDKPFRIKVEMLFYI